MDNQKIGTYITSLRKNKNLTQKELADLLGVTDKAVSKWERGAGYPDISLLKPLADALGTTINELLDGETAEDKMTGTQEHITNALEYAGEIIHQKERNKGKLFASLLAISLLISIFVCVIVNVAVNRELSWSYLVIDGCVMGGCLFLPPLVWKKKGFLISLALLSILILPFLGVIQTVVNTWYSGSAGADASYSQWLWKIGFPVSYIWLILIWFMILLKSRTKVSLWFLSCIGALLCIPGQAITNEVIYRAIESENASYVRSVSFASTAVILITTAGILFIIGLMKRKR